MKTTEELREQSLKAWEKTQASYMRPINPWAFSIGYMVAFREMERLVEETPKYRLLSDGETTQEGDEFLSMPHYVWVPVVYFPETYLSEHYQLHRRKIK